MSAAKTLPGKDYLTALTIASNAFGSFIARSAITLRLRTMPLALSLVSAELLPVSLVMRRAKLKFLLPAICIADSRSLSGQLQKAVNVLSRLMIFCWRSKNGLA